MGPVIGGTIKKRGKVSTEEFVGKRKGREATMGKEIR